MKSRQRLFEFEGTYYTAIAHSAAGAWLLIKDKCANDGHAKPTFDKIKEVNLFKRKP